MVKWSISMKNLTTKSTLNTELGKFQNLVIKYYKFRPIWRESGSRAPWLGPVKQLLFVLFVINLSSIICMLTAISHLIKPTKLGGKEPSRLSWLSPVSSNSSSFSPPRIQSDRPGDCRGAIYLALNNERYAGTLRP